MTLPAPTIRPIYNVEYDLLKDDGSGDVGIYQTYQKKRALDFAKDKVDGVANGQASVYCFHRLVVRYFKNDGVFGEETESEE